MFEVFEPYISMGLSIHGHPWHIFFGIARMIAKKGLQVLADLSVMLSSLQMWDILVSASLWTLAQGLLVQQKTRPILSVYLSYLWIVLIK